jgi:riboflavin-specific deaminase-like protein
LRPEVIVNFAMSADGKISTRALTPSTFTSKADKRRLSEIRALGDALIVGRNTVAADSMTMGISAADLRARRVGEGRPPVPLRVIVSERGRFDPGWKVFTCADSPVILCTARKIPARLARRFPPFVRILEFPGPGIPIPSLLERLRADWGVKTLVCEGGPALLKSMLEADAVDELRLTIAPLLIGGERAPGLTGMPSGFLPEERRFRLKAMEQSDGEVFLRYLRDRRFPKASSVSSVAE